MVYAEDMIRTCYSIETDMKKESSSDHNYNCDRYRKLLLDYGNNYFPGGIDIGCSYEFYKSKCSDSEAYYKQQCNEDISNVNKYVSKYGSPSEYGGDMYWVISYCSEAIDLAEYHYCDLKTVCSACSKLGASSNTCKWGAVGTWPPEEQQAKITLTMNPSSGKIPADGESGFIIIVEATSNGKPVDGEEIKVSLSKNSGSWEGDIGKLSKSSVWTDSNGRAMVEYMPPLIAASELQDKLEIKIQASAKDASASGTYELAPEEVDAGVTKIKAVQAINVKNVPMVAGKKLAVMVVVNTTGPEVFSPQEDRSYILTFTAQAKEKNGQVVGEFMPFPTYVLPLDEEISDSEVEIVEGKAADEYLSFLGVTKEQGKLYRVYIFYLDHPKTDLSGYYYFDAQVSMLKLDSSGEIKEKKLGGLYEAVDVFPSKPFYLIVEPVAIGTWSPDVCDYCVVSGQTGEPIYDCKRSEIIGYPSHMPFDFAWNGKFDLNELQQALIRGLQPSATDKEKVCTDGFKKSFTQADITQLGSKSPATYNLYPDANGVPLTPAQRYEQLVSSSLDYFIAVMPVAEEDIHIRVFHEPQKPPRLASNVESPSIVLLAVQDQFDAFVWSSRYFRIAGIVPVDLAKNSFGKGFSNLDFGVEGYSNSLLSDEVVLVSHQLSGSTTLVHEIAHTYCAIDEYESAFMRFVQAGLKVPLTCAYSFEASWINSRLGSDSKGTPVTYGFWVDERKFMGTPQNPKYSFMGDAADDQQWITEQLYYGIGRNLEIFPRPVDPIDYAPKHPYYIKD